MMPQVFTILSPHEVNTVLWEQCLQKNIDNASLYMHFNYLNTITDNWLAVVNQDYSILTAIPYRKKWGIQYACTTPFIQATSIIGAISVSEKKALLQCIQKKLRYGTIAIKHINELGIGETKTNFYLPLQAIYNSIQNNFSNDVKKNIKKAGKYQLNYLQIHRYTVHEAIAIYRSLNGSKTPHIIARHYDKLLTYCITYTNDYYIRIVQNHNCEMVAIALLLKKYNKLYNILNAVTPEGKKLGANHFLLSSILEEFSNTDLIFDFEGSSITGIQQFYQGFNPVPEYYTIYRYNMLLRFKP